MHFSEEVRAGKEVAFLHKLACFVELLSGRALSRWVLCGQPRGSLLVFCLRNHAVVFHSVCMTHVSPWHLGTPLCPVLFFFFFFLFGCPAAYDVPRPVGSVVCSPAPVAGDPSHSCDLSHSSSNTGSLTHCTRLGIEPTPLQ